MRLQALDGLRGLAVILVVVLHTKLAASAVSSSESAYLALTGFGWTGVDLFFVLSGFLITGILVDTREDRHFFRTFYARRILRIFPLYYAYLIFVYVVLAKVHPLVSPGYSDAVRHQWWYWLYLTNVRIALHGWASSPGTTHFWSLAIEEQFYIAWPAVVWLIGRRPRRLFTVALLAAVASVASRFATTSWTAGSLPAYVLTPLRLDALCVGAMIAAAVRDERWRSSVARLGPYLAVAGTTGVIALAAIHGTWDAVDGVVQRIGYTLLTIMWGGLLIVLVLGNSRSFVHRAFSHRALRSAGKYSYAMYVLHPFIIDVVGARFGRWRTPATARLPEQLVYAALLLALSYAAARVSWAVLEAPMLRLKRFFEYREPTSPLGSAAVAGRATAMESAITDRSAL
jgi:peptidoglycan/LPS O-acetylase OafA/YrhL